MSFATIVFTDIVSFSKQDPPEQKVLIKSFNQFIGELTEISNEEKLLNRDVVALPTGDGMALAFIQSNDSSEDPKILIEFCIKLHLWAYKHHIELRIGVQYGAVHLLKDINGQPNICGDTINDTQRIMDGGGGGQVIFSEKYVNQYVRDKDIIDWQPGCLKEKFPEDKFTLFFSEEFDIVAKHGRVIEAKQLHLIKSTKKAITQLKNNAQEELKKLKNKCVDELAKVTPEFWSNLQPEGKMRMQLNLNRSRFPRGLSNDFTDPLHNAERVALVLLTGENLINRLESETDDEKVFGENLRELIVLMPDALKESQELDPSYNEDKYLTLKERWQTYLQNFSQENPNALVKLGFFTQPPYFGASFLNWQSQNGRIHVSPYVWGTDTSNNPAFDVEWKGKTMPPVYKVYAAGLDALNEKTKNVLKNN